MADSAATVAAAPADLVEVGLLRGSYGLQGWAHVQPHSGDAQVLRSSRAWWLLGPAANQTVPAVPLDVTGVRTQGAALVAKWCGCDDPEVAQALKGRRIAVSRQAFPQLPQGQYYWVDLIGTCVVNRAGCKLGTVQGLRSNGAHDLLEVQPEGAAKPNAARLIPMVGPYIDAVDLAGGTILVDWDEQW